MDTTVDRMLVLLELAISCYNNCSKLMYIKVTIT